MSRAVANTLLPAARPASTIARPRPRELPVTNHTCAIHPPLYRSQAPGYFWRSVSNSGLGAKWVYERTGIKAKARLAHLHDGSDKSGLITLTSCVFLEHRTSIALAQIA